MSDNNQFKPYRYNQGQQSQNTQQTGQGLNLSAAPRYAQNQPRRRGNVLGKPLVLAGIGGFAVFFLCVMLINAIMGDTPQSDGDIPIVQADATPVKSAPGDQDIYRFPNADSTIYQNTDLAALDTVEAGDYGQLQPIVAESKMQMLERQAAAMAAKAPAAGNEDTDLGAPEIENATTPVTVESQTQEPAPQALKTPNKAETPQKRVAYPAAASPETLAYVRSVLDQKDQKKSDTQSAVTDKNNAAKKIKKDDAYRANAIQPAAGHPDITITSGAYYVQLASVKDQTGAVREWGKLKGKFSHALANTNYRVSRAELPKGTFFRIQAGPMSRTSANQVCGAVKDASGSCFVTK